MEKAGRLAAEALKHTGSYVRAGITTLELDTIANDFIRTRGAVSACVGYRGYPQATCISVNDVVCHGLPGERILVPGDMLNIDITVLHQGFHGDTSAMFFVGEATGTAKIISECAHEAMLRGIRAARSGATTGDIGFAVEKYVTRRGFHAYREIGGHGIGTIFHDEPFVPSFGKKGRGPKLVKWGTITVEPIVNENALPLIEEAIPGSEITVFRTSDGSLSAQYEHTILITDADAQILTLA